MLRHVRLFTMLALLAALVAVPVGPTFGREPGADRASARQGRLAYPPAPRAGYRPGHVRQSFNNCAFASAQMLVDKWTRGRRSAPQQALRRATGILPADGGPTLGQLRQAVAKVSGLDLRWSPNGGDPMSWQDLLSRLENGGGAIVNVWPEKLPRHYRRWLPSLVAGHSVYVERYEHAKDRIWLMDPLGRGAGFQGEWIDADALNRAMWHTNGLVWAASTPRPEPRPPALADFEIGSPEVPPEVFVDEQITVVLPFSAQRLDASLPGLRLAATWELAGGEAATDDADGATETDPVGPGPAPTPDLDAAAEPDADTDRLSVVDLAALEAMDPPQPRARAPATAPDQQPVTTPAPEPEVIPSRRTGMAQNMKPYGAAQPKPIDRSAPLLPLTTLSEHVLVRGKTLEGLVQSPALPGDYLLRLQLRKSKGETLTDEVPRFAPIAITVRGPLAGALALRLEPPATAAEGQTLELSVKAANLGRSRWGSEAEPVAIEAAFGKGPRVKAPLELAAGAKVVIPLRVWVGIDAGPATLAIALVGGDGEPLPESEAIELALEVLPGEPRAAELR